MNSFPHDRLVRKMQRIVPSFQWNRWALAQAARYKQYSVHDRFHAQCFHRPQQSWYCLFHFPYQTQHMLVRAQKTKMSQGTHHNGLW